MKRNRLFLMLCLVAVPAMIVAVCWHSDPIDRLMHRVSHESVPSYPYKPIDLPASATPEELITSLSKRRALDLGHFDFRDYKIAEIRSVQTEPPYIEKYTALLLDTDMGRRIVLLQPPQGTKSMGWYYKTYDVK